MKSEHPSTEQVLDDLGDKVAHGLVLMVAPPQIAMPGDTEHDQRSDGVEDR